MPDDKKKRGAADRARVSAGEAYEVTYVAKKTGKPKEEVLKAIKAAGPSRKKVMAKLKPGKV